MDINFLYESNLGNRSSWTILKFYLIICKTMKEGKGDSVHPFLIALIFNLIPPYLLSFKEVISLTKT